MDLSLKAHATYQARLATFTAPKTKSRRPSSTRGKKAAPKAAPKAGWPLDYPRPEDLAYAGFIFRPTSTSPDNVQCYHCQTQLDGWEPNDTPAHEHLTHSPNCGFAINICIRMRGSDPGRTEDDPLSEHMMEARKETFQDMWPLDVAAGYPSVEQMVEGGWYYDPSDEYADGATCPYCSLSLDSWDIGDDPTEQHQQRAADCMFFSLKEYYHPTHTQKPKAARGKRASTRSSTASTKARKATRTKKAAAKDVDKPLPAPPDETMTDSIAVSLPDSTDATMMSVPASAPTAKRGRRAKKGSTADDTMVSVADTVAGGLGLSMISIPPKAPPAKRGRKPKNSSILEDTPAQSFTGSVAEPAAVPTQPPAKAPAKKGRKPKNAAPQPEIPESFAESFAGSVASTMSKATGKGRQTRKATKRASTISAAPSTRSTRGTKRKSEEMDVDNDADVEMEMEVEVEEQQPSPKRTRLSNRLSNRLSDISLPQFESTPLHTPKEYRNENARPETIKSPIAHLRNGTPKASTPRTAVRPAPGLRSPFQSFVNSPLGVRSPIRARPQTPEEPQTPEAAPPSESRWDPIIISNIINDAGLDQENMDIDMADSTENVTKAVLASLTSPEKRMTIEQFVLHNAKRGEEKLRKECERQIAAFKAEGRRALAALDAF